MHLSNDAAYFSKKQAELSKEVVRTIKEVGRSFLSDSYFFPGKYRTEKNVSLPSETGCATFLKSQGYNLVYCFWYFMMSKLVFSTGPGVKMILLPRITIAVTSSSEPKICSCENQCFK
jgi:hypothetical protein